MRTIFLDKESMLINIVVHIAANMVAALPNYNVLTLLSYMTCNYCANDAATNN